MVKPDHKACLSTSASVSRMTPPSPVEPSPGAVEDEGEPNVEAEPRAQVHEEKRNSTPRPDYILVSAYILVYLEVAWLIFVLLRMYSRD